MSKYVFVKDDTGFQAQGYSNGKIFSLGRFKTKELAKEAKNFFNNECGRDLEKYKQSKYWKELRGLNGQSEGYEKKGTIFKTSPHSYQTSFQVNGIKVILGSFKTEELAREAINFFVNECHENIEEYKQSKYWKELRNIGVNSPDYEKEGCIYKTPYNIYQVRFFKSASEKLHLGNFETEGAAQEALDYFLKECNCDFDKYKQSKYWLERTDKRSLSKSYWEKGKVNARNTSGITGVRWDKSNNYWEACIRIDNKRIHKFFKSKENAIKYRDFLVEQGKEFNENWDEARKQKQMEFIKEQGEKLAQELKNNSDEKKAIEEEKQETTYEFTPVEE